MKVLTKEAFDQAYETGDTSLLFPEVSYELRCRRRGETAWQYVDTLPHGEAQEALSEAVALEDDYEYRLWKVTKEPI